MNNLVRSIFAAAVIVLSISAASAQTAPAPTPSPAPSPTPNQKIDLKNLTAEQVAELAILSYSNLGGRDRLNQIRKTTSERGRITLTAADGQVQQANYVRYVIRGENLTKEKVRLDQEFPTARYALVSSDEQIFGIYNNSKFAPTDAAVKTFENQLTRGIEALLRYKENGSTLEPATREKILGVDYYVLDLTDKQQRKTRFFVSSKSFRVMMLDYEEAGVKYRRRFYDYNYAQGTLVPFRSVLWADNKIVEEVEIGTVTFGQKVEPTLFLAS